MEPHPNPLATGAIWLALSSTPGQAVSEPSISAISASTLRRFALRTAILLAWCAVSAEPFSKIMTFSGALAAFCIAFAVVQRERALAPELNNWDEASFYLMISHGAVLAGRL